MTEPQEPQRVKAAKKESCYVILRQGADRDDGMGWLNLGEFEGPATAAMKRAARAGASEEFNEGSYVAIPARSFKPVKLATKTETRVTLS